MREGKQQLPKQQQLMLFRNSCTSDAVLRLTTRMHMRGQLELHTNYLSVCTKPRLFWVSACMYMIFPYPRPPENFPPLPPPSSRSSRTNMGRSECMRTSNENINCMRPMHAPNAWLQLTGTYNILWGIPPNTLYTNTECTCILRYNPRDEGS